MIYRREIDGLRALAVLSVIFYHAGFQVFKGGFVGVDVFFVISGYLISLIIFEGKSKNSFEFLKFTERRIRRIFPALIFVMLVSLPFAWYILPPPDLKGMTSSLAAVILLISNFYFRNQSGYFDVAGELKPFLHSWSLSVELQYYLIFPFILIFIYKYFKKWKFEFLSILALLSLGLAQWMIYKSPSHAFFLLPTRAWEFLVGGLAAYYLYNRNTTDSIGWYTSEAGGLLGLFLIGTAVLFFDQDTQVPAWPTLIPTLGTVLIIIFSSDKTLVGKFLGVKILFGIGLISYSLYLWHQPIFAFARHSNSEYLPYSIKIILISITFIAGFISWKYIEKPFRSNNYINKKLFFISIFFVGSLFLIIAWTANKTNGFYSYRTTFHQRLLFESSLSSPKRKMCHTGGEFYLKPADACEYFEGKLNYAVFGDSHAAELAYSLATELQHQNIKIKHFSFSNCIPTFGVYYQDKFKYCSEWTRETVDYISSNADISTVVISYRINSALSGPHEGSYPQLPNVVSPEDKILRWNSYKNLVNHFANHGKKVILVLQAPELPENPQKIIFKLNNSVDKIVGVSREWWRNRNEFVYKNIKNFPRSVTIIDPANLLCESDFCLIARNDTSYYFDDDHLSIVGAQLVAKEILIRLN